MSAVATQPIVFVIITRSVVRPKGRDKQAQTQQLLQSDPPGASAIHVSFLRPARTEPSRRSSFTANFMGVCKLSQV